MAEKIDAQTRAKYFQISTRQNMQMVQTKKTSVPNSTLEFTLPKARLLSNIYLRVKAKLNVKHPTKTSLNNDFLTPYKIIQQFKLDLNNGFSPYTISGVGLALLNYINKNTRMYNSIASDYFTCGKTFTASAEGTDNEFFFTVQLPVTLNDRDAVGLLLLQSEQTVADLRVAVGNPYDMYTEEEANGYTLDLKDLEVMPMLETFSIPANAEAFPDLSILKLCMDRVDSITAAGQNIVKLSTGTIYRKLALYITDEDGKPMTADKLNGTIDLVFNQADCNYSIAPDMLRAMNCYKLGSQLPEGVYIFDFSDGSYGSSRDYIDTEKLTEFWLRFNTTSRGKVRIISECLSRLI